MTHVHTGPAQAWAALGGDPALLDRISYGGAPGALPGVLPAMELARATVAVCSLAAAELAAQGTGADVPAVRVDDGAVTAAFHSERLVRLDGRKGATFAPLSRFWRTADGWVRTHANYPHHRARLLTALGLPQDSGPQAVAAVLATRGAQEVEESVYAAGGLAVAARTRQEWAAHPQGAAAAARPLVSITTPHQGPVRAPHRAAGSAGPLLPAAGLRVLDLTRVLAGPVATRTLALLGADVLRLDPPGLPESQDTLDDTGVGKRSARLDLRERSGSARFEELLERADVVVLGYRPGALDGAGASLSPDALAERRPGLVTARLSAWGGSGPWRERRGFDSLVQAATGIALTEGTADSPGVLPAQALDHGSGYLLAAGVLRALTEQHRTGGARMVDLSLARTAHWLLNGLPPRHTSTGDPRPADAGAADSEPARAWMREVDSPRGRLRHAASPVAFDGGPTNWSRPSGPWGADEPEWL